MTIESVDALLITTKADAASDAVADLLSQRNASFFRLNTEDLPLVARASVSVNDAHALTEWTVGNSRVCLSGAKRVWFRRHRLPMLRDGEPADLEYCLRESEWFLRGVLFALGDALPHAGWMNHPIDVWRAESKVYQLAVAKRCGLQVPETLISNDPIAIRAFYENHRGRIVAKPLRLGYFDYGDVQKAAFTTTLTAEDLTDDEALAAAPVIYQRHVNKQCDIRVTIVNDSLFAAEIRSQEVPSARVDWRQTEVDLSHLVHALPVQIESACRALMRMLHLRFGALDFALAGDGQYYFFEINPSGQWLWLEDKLGFPISQSMASWLAESKS
jgi:glutathione synthase/RimK-type ligase-like ATP-grasp enzyme